MRITESIMMDFVFGYSKFKNPIFKDDMSIEPNTVEFEDGKKMIVSYTFRVQDGDIKYIYNFSPLTCDQKIVSGGKLLFSHDLSDQWSVYHVRHAIMLDGLERMIKAGISELENLYKLSNVEIELIKIENDHKKMAELLDIIEDRKYNGSKNLIARLTKKFLKPKKEEKQENPYLVNNEETEDKTSSASFDWDPKDFGM